MSRTPKRRRPARPDWIAARAPDYPVEDPPPPRRRHPSIFLAHVGAEERGFDSQQVFWDLAEATEHLGSFDALDDAIASVFGCDDRPPLAGLAYFDALDSILPAVRAAFRLTPFDPATREGQTIGEALDLLSRFLSWNARRRRRDEPTPDRTRHPRRIMPVSTDLDAPAAAETLAPAPADDDPPAAAPAPARRIFPYNDGRRPRYGDPMVIQRALYRAVPGGDLARIDEALKRVFPAPPVDGAEADALPPAQDFYDAADFLANVARDAFELHPFDPESGEGLTIGEQLSLLPAFIDWTTSGGGPPPVADAQEAGPGEGRLATA